MNNQLACVAVLAGALGLWMLGGVHREAPLVGHDKLTGLDQLEQRVASAPHDEAALEELGRSYVERGAPGLAVAAFRRAPSAVTKSPPISHLWAVALLHEGQATPALEKEREVLEACQQTRCAGWLLASAIRHEGFLSAMVRQGVEDYLVDPEAAELAFQRVQRGTVAVLETPDTPARQ
jgi:hypothetical protein